MRKIIVATVVFMFFSLSFLVMAKVVENKPVAVSPGSETEAVTVWQSCPTFSWSAVQQAVSYRLAVFESPDANVLTYEEMAAMTTPVISKDIPGPALSWTLPAEEKLKTGGQYAWYVQALEASGNALGSWSGGRTFKVEQEVRFVGIEEKLGEILKSYGVNEETITNVLNDMKSGVQEVVVRGANNTEIISTPDLSGVQGTEGVTNTFYGLLAGYSNTTGSGNCFFGYLTANANTSGNYNTILGRAAGYYNTSGNSNIFLGHQSGYYNTSGSLNTFLGVEAGMANTTGSGNLFLGYHAGYDETGSNKLYIENSGTSSPLIYGEFDNNIVTINGKLGIGTTTPAYPVEVDTTGINSCIVVKRTDGATNYINATADYANFGSVTNHPLRLVVNSIWKMRLDSDGSLTMSNGASCTSGGTWTNASSRSLKENIQSLTPDEAIHTLEGLNPVKYNYKVDKTDKHVGFIAEDVPDLVASADRKGLSPMDVTAVLTRVVQEQQNSIQEYKKIISDLRERIEKLEKK